jgi:dihydrolipoamide dehydrogenase
LSREEPRVSELLHAALEEDGIAIHVDAKVDSVRAEDGQRVARFGSEQVRAEELIVAVGRKPRLDELALEKAGIDAGEQGIAIDERCRAAEGVWAVGDVTGVMPFTHIAKYQGRVVVADILGRPRRASYEAVPRVVFSDPEVAAVGMTQAQARDAGVEVVTAHVNLAETISRPSTYETDPRGELAILVDRGRGVLVGAWAVGPLAGEWIHYAALAIKTATPVRVLRDTVAQFPTYTEGYLKALEELPD